MNSKSSASSLRSSFPAQFLAKGIILTVVFAVLTALVFGLFEDSSDSDFNPTQPGTLFAAYHMAVGILLLVLFAPVLVLQGIDYLSGMNLAGQDTFCYIFAAVSDGFFVAAIWAVFKRYRSRFGVDSNVREAANQIR